MVLPFARLLSALLLGLTATVSLAQTPTIPLPGRAPLPGGRERLTAFLRDSLSVYCRREMARWQVPAAAVSVVHGGQTLFEGGFGATQVDGQGRPAGRPVGPHTRFLIASNSKLMTGTVMAWAAHRGALDLSAPVQKYLPDFQVYDPRVSPLVTVEDMLVHRLGTETFQGDFTFWNSTLDAASVIARMRTLEPVRPYAQGYGYCNSCYAVAGQVLARTTGRPWADWVTDSILRPLGMDSSFAMAPAAIAIMGPVARPYTSGYGGRLRPVPFDRWDNMAPAASVVSTAHDLSAWLKCLIDSGRYQGRQVIPYPALERTRMASMVVSSRASPRFLTTARLYGLGIQVSDYASRQLYHHTGGSAGHLSSLCFMPAEGLGIAILTTNDDQSFFEALRYQLLHVYLGMPYDNLSLRFWQSGAPGRAADLDSLALYARLVEARPAPPAPIESFAGTYQHPTYGTIDVTSHPSRGRGRRASVPYLEVRFSLHPDLSCRLEPMGGHRWRATYSNPEYGVLPAETGQAGSPDQATSGLPPRPTITLRVNEFIERGAYTFVRLR